jgi:hypothetical protein
MSTTTVVISKDFTEWRAAILDWNGVESHRSGRRIDGPWQAVSHLMTLYPLYLKDVIQLRFKK